MSSERWFAIDQYNGDSELFNTKEEALQWAKDAIPDGSDGWPEELLDGAVKVGKVLYESSMTNKREVPKDDDGEPINSDFDFLCDCEMVEVEEE